MSILMWHTSLVVPLFSRGGGRCFSDRLMFYINSTSLYSGYCNLLHTLPASSLPNQPNIPGGDTSLLLCSVEHPFCHVTCFTICFLSVIPSVSSQVQKKYLCVNGDYTSLLLCFFKPIYFVGLVLILSFFKLYFQMQEIIIYKSLLLFFFNLNGFVTLLYFLSFPQDKKNRSVTPFIKVNRRYAEPVH